MARPSNREKILVATEAVAAELGAAHLTLEAVAAKAKMSKGGLLYHFKDKDALLMALMERYVSKCLEQRAADTERLGGDVTAMLKAFMLNQWGERPVPPRLHNALLAASATNPRMLSSVRDVASRSMDVYRDSFEGMNETLMLVLAGQGMMLLDLLQVQPFTDEERKNARDYLLARADQLATKPGVKGKRVLDQTTFFKK